MLSICSWRFSHMATDIGKLCLSTILVMLQELPMSFILKFTKHRFLPQNDTLIREEFCLILDNFEKNYRVADLQSRSKRS